MPRTMLKDQHWSKLLSIFRHFNIYLKSNLEISLKLFYFVLELAALGEIYLCNLANQTPFLKNIIDGLKTVNS